MMDYRYNNKIETDIDKSVIQPLIVLATRSGRKIGVINNIQELRCNHPLASASEISFDVYKEINGVKNPYWDLIKDFKFIYLPTVKDSKFKWYEITIAIDEGNDTIKHVTGIHANEAELGQLMLYNVEINTEEDINRDDYEIITIDDKEYGTVFYNPDHPKASLLHRILSDKASHYSILHVDETLKNIQREFSFNGTSIVDALNQTVAQEIGCLFVYGQNPNNEDDGIFHRTISAYDLMDYCEDCGERGTYTQGVCTKCGSTRIKGGYGKDTGIFINSENLSDSISLTSSTDQVKNFFKMGAGDEYMEAAIRNCNPNGSSYLYYFSDEMKEDMSDELISKLNEYNTLYDSYLKDYDIALQTDGIVSYNALVRKYQDYIKEDLVELQTSAHGYEELTDYYYNSLNFKDMLQTVMMPASEEVTETTAQEQLDKLTVESMSPIGVEDASAMSLTAADTAVKSYAKVYVDTSRYKIELSDSAYVNNYWTGTITITSLTDEEDTDFKELTIQFNNDGATFLKQKIEKAMKEHEAEDIGDVSFLQREYTDEELETDFKPELKKYSLDALSLLDDLCVAVMDILADAGQGEESSDYYEDFYHPFWKKRKLIMDEEKTRESEIATVEGVIVNIEEVRADIINYLDLHNYFGDELYSELMLYRRETEYSNPNFISDGLSDSEVIDRARDYFKRAQEEIIKASTLQHSISASLYNLFLIPEFRKTVLDNNEVQYQEDIGFFPVETFSNKLINLFDGGNWLRIRVDDKIYKLRLTNWEINYDDPEQLEVEFSDVVYSGNTVSDIASVLSQARTMATSYDAVMRQAEKGNTANNTIEQTKKQGLILNQNKIINNVDSQSFVLNSQGALMRAKNDFDDGYSPEQIKLLNKGIYYTNDDWETVKAGLGHFMYYDPDTKTVKEDYGIIASTIVGQLLLGENLKIYSESGKFEMGDNGLVITAVEGEDNTDLFVVQKEKTDEQGRKYVEKYIYVDSNGEVQIRGNSVVLGGKPLIEYINDAIDDADIDVSLPVSVQLDSSTGVVFNSDSISATLTATVYRGGTDITSQITEFVWTKRDKNGNVDSSWTKTTSINTLDVNIDNINDKVIIGCEVEVPQEGVTTTSYGSITISKIHDGSQIWTSSVAPTTPNYTFTISNLVGDSDTSIKVGDIILNSYYRYTVLSIANDGTTVLTGNRTSIRGATGAASVTYSLIVSNLAIIKDKNGDISPVAITLTAKSQTGSNAMANYSGRFKIETTTDNSTWTTQYTSSANEATKTWSVIDDIVAIRCSLYLAGGTTTLLDQQTIPIVSDGIDGTNVTITSTSVTYQKGTSGTTKPTGTWGTSIPSVGQGEYLWTKTVVTYSDSSSTESYSVSRNAVNGTNGVSPTVTSTVTEYVQSDSGTNTPTSGWNTTPPTATAGKYMWTKVTVTYSDNATAVSYTVSKNGTNGNNGINTATVYLYKRGTTTPSVPSGNTTYTFSTKQLTGTLDNWSQTIPTTGDGECYVIAAVASSNGTTDTIGTGEWSAPIQFNGTNGTNGTDGTNGLNQATIFLYKRGASVTKPTTSVTYTFSTGALSAEPNSWKRNIPTIDGNPCWVVTATAIGNGTTATITGSNWSDPVKLVEDGEDGKDAYTIILTNENHTFAGNTTSAIASEIECNVIAYKGAIQVASTIGTITGQPTGMTTTILNNGTVNTAFRVSVTTSMVTKNGVLNVPVTVDGKAFTKKFTYALTLDGEKGDKGDTAQWYYGESLTHTSGTATLPISQTDDVAIGAMYLNTKTGSYYKCTAISGSNATWTYAGNITDGINIGGRNLWINTLTPDVSSPDNYPRMVGQIDYTRVASTANNDVAIAEHGIKNIVKKVGKRPRFDFGLLTSTNGFENGQTYTVSFDWTAKLFSSDTDTTTKYLGFYIYDNHTGSNAINEACTDRFFVITTNLKGVEQSGRMEFTFTTEESASIIRISIMGNSDTGQAIGDYFELRNMKLEKGNKATDWTPAPEDINAEISTKADSTDAVFEEQLIYISKASGTLSVDGTTTWVSESGDVQNTWSTKRPTYDTNYPVLFIAKQRKTVSGTISCTTPIKDDTTTVIDGGHITTGTIDASVVTVTNINADEIKTGTISIRTVSGLQSSLNDKASNSALANATGWSVIISVTIINYSTNSATLEATVYKDGTKQTTGFTLEWYKTKTTNGTTSTSKLTTTTSTLSVDDLDASYTCVVN